MSQIKQNGIASPMATEIEQLLQSMAILNAATEDIVSEWRHSGEGLQVSDTGIKLPSKALYQAQRAGIAALGKIQELIVGPEVRLMEYSGQFFESRALHLCAEYRIADLLEGQDELGVSTQALEEKTGLAASILGRMIRCLSSNGIFREVTFDHFANNRISASLVRNESLRAYILVYSKCHFKVAEALPAAISDTVKGRSSKVDETAFNIANGTDRPFFEWMEEKIVGEDGTEQTRPELPLFAKAMVAVGKVTSTVHIFDYPWESLGDQTVVDVGGGFGGFATLLAQHYPKLRIVVQDRAEVVAKGVDHLQQQDAKLAEEGRIEFIAHDFFAEQPVKGAAVYWLRYILHDWPKDECVKILRNLISSMSKDSRIVIAELILNTTVGCAEIPDAPKPLPANYGIFPRYSHQRDLVMLSLFNSAERTPDQFREIFDEAGLVIERIVECRSQTGLIVCRLP